MLLGLLVGMGVLLVSLLLFGMATALIVDLVVSLIRKGYAGRRFWKNIAVMMIVSLVTAAAHLLQIALWAVALLLLEEVFNLRARILLLRRALHRTGPRER